MVLPKMIFLQQHKLKNTMIIIKYFINFFKKIKRRYKIAKAYPELKKVYEKQLKERRKLKQDVNTYLKAYFKLDAQSKFIPLDFKNKEQVRLAIISKFGITMQNLNISYSDLFK